MKTLFFSLIFLFAFWLTHGQNLIFYKEKKEHWLTKNSSLTLVLKDDTRLKGQIDTFTVKTLTIRTTNKEQVMLDISNIKAYKQKLHIWHIGRFHSLLTFWTTKNIEDFECKIKL